jgi:hypothetical protein
MLCCKYTYNIKVWWHAATLFISFYINRAYIPYVIQYIILVERHSLYPHSFRSVEGLLWGAEPRFELGPAIEQADTPHPSLCHAAPLAVPRRTLTVPRRTLTVPRRTLKLCHAAPAHKICSLKSLLYLVL